MIARTSVSATILFVSLLSACGTHVPGSTGTGRPTASAAGEFTSGEPLGSSFAGASPGVTHATAPSDLPTPTPLQPLELQTNTAVRVIVAELNVREGPSLSTTRVATVDKQSVFVLVGYEPTLADGYVWWYVSQVANSIDGELPPLPIRLHTSGPVAGYIATAKGPTPYVEALAPRCPTAWELANVAAMIGGERAHCSADKPVTVTGTMTCGPCEGIGPPQTYEPRWLADESLSWLPTAPNIEWQDLELKFPPELAPGGFAGFDKPPVPYGSIVRVVGHFNDPRSASCVVALYVDDDTSHPVADSYAEQACRQEFVVESFEALGIDPDYEAPY